MILDGRKVAKQREEDLAKRVAKLATKPCLAVILVGDDPASHTYVSMKIKACGRVGILSERYFLPDSCSEKELLTLIAKLNDDVHVHGILVQLPLPKQIDKLRVLEHISPLKDVDAFNPKNQGLLYSGNRHLTPCTPLGIMHLLEAYHLDLASKHAVVIGRSTIVGRPIAQLLLEANATVTMCHSYTKDLAQHTLRADILIVAAGKQGLVTGEMVKEGCIVVDVGSNRCLDETTNKTCYVGDVDYPSVSKKASYLSPVPGGVGPMTIITLLENTLSTYHLLED